MCGDSNCETRSIGFPPCFLFSSHLSSSYFPGIPKVLLLLTDGHSNGIKPLQPADDLRKTGVSIFSIGVGSSVSQTELKEIASDPDSDYVFKLDSFDQLAGFVDRVSSVSCSGRYYSWTSGKSCNEAHAIGGGGLSGWVQSGLFRQQGHSQLTHSFTSVRVRKWQQNCRAVSIANFTKQCVFFHHLEGSLIDSCKGAETSVESGSFKYFRTTFDVVTKDEVSIEVRDVVG